MSEPVRGWRNQDLDHIRRDLIKEGDDIIALKEKIGKKQWQLYASDALEHALDSSAYSTYSVNTDEKSRSGTTSASSTPSSALTRAASSSQMSTRRFFSDVPPIRPSSLSQDSGRLVSPASTPTPGTLAPEDRFSEIELMQQKCLYRYFLRFGFDQLYKYEVIPSFYTKEIIELVYITQVSTKVHKAKEEESPGSQEYFLAKHYSLADAAYLQKKFMADYATQFPNPKPLADELGQKALIAKTVMDTFKDHLLVHKSMQRTGDDFSRRFSKIIGKLDDYKIQQALNKSQVAGRILHPAEDQRREEERVTLASQISDPHSPNIPKVPRSPVVTKPTSPDNQGIELSNIPKAPAASSKGHVRSPTDLKLQQRSQTPPLPFMSPNRLRIHRDPNTPIVISVN